MLPSSLVAIYLVCCYDHCVMHDLPFVCGNKTYLTWLDSALVQLTDFRTDWLIEWTNTFTLWRHQMDTFSALLAICAGNSLVPGEFPAQRPVTRSFDVFFDQHPNKRLSKHSWCWWFETPSRPLWRHRNEKRQRVVCKAFIIFIYTDIAQ